jgi:hypothetical protein
MERIVGSGLPPDSTAHVEDQQRVLRLRDADLAVSRAIEARFAGEIGQLSQLRDSDYGVNLLAGDGPPRCAARILTRRR